MRRHSTRPDREAAVDAFVAAAKTVENRLLGRAAEATGAAAEVLQANAAMAADRGWIGAAKKSIAGGVPPVQAAIAATEQFVVLFTKVGGLMAERVTDLEDIRDRVIAELSGLPEPGVPMPETPSVLGGNDLAPADTAGLDASKIIGLVTIYGAARPAIRQSSRGSWASRASSPRRNWNPSRQLYRF